MEQDSSLYRALAVHRPVRRHGLMIAIYWLLAYVPPGRVDHWFRRLQPVSAAFFSLNHGGATTRRRRRNHRGR
jgi:hypothetical protein